MYNLLIVDDEAIIADYIADIFINSDMLGESLLNVMKSTSAFEALDVMRNRNVDIVLSDVSMPGMNGIDLLRKIKELWPDTKVVLMSGYDEFEYIQAAMRYDSIDYVLKAEGEEQFIVSVKKAVNALDDEIKNSEIVRRAAQNLKLIKSVFIENLLTDILDGHQYEENELLSRFSEVEIPLSPAKPVFIIIGKPASSSTTVISHDKLYKTKILIEEYFKESMCCTSLLYERRLLWLLQPLEEDVSVWNQSITKLIGRLDSIQKMCAEMLDINISFSVAQYPVQWHDLAHAFRELDISMAASPFIDNSVITISQICSESNCNDKEAISKAYLAIKRIASLEVHLSDGNRGEFFNMFDDIMAALKKLPPGYNSIKQQAIFSLTSHFLSVINKMNNADGDLILKVPSEAQSWDEVESYFSDIADKLFKKKEESGCAGTNEILDFVNNYATEHIDEDLSLSRFAEMLHYHPFYLSRLFKQITGMTFSNYIAEIKMNRAKEMLMRNEIKIADIALTLGFDNASYFTRFFKRHMNMSPQEYRSGVQALT
ncbi:response regulator transcription factor [Mahella australiensis]|uniref:Stage 0 sporulation protein A homolog n=1 Tax=Mahella australiensis (strain DSM 15567 / CIP 107919 / 50-1 BON) TaxID=697281 RepID=F4A0U4_MAHA5|nr:helix-turn-helix domain-containing protein [Mahella australiensis]AEE96990.1 two component transcriptional regulator, AraC family [Mahella australiensis 50-1 BON]